MNQKVIAAEGAPKPIGPYSQAIAAGEFLFCSGQIPLDPKTGTLVQGDIKAQASRILENLEAVLKAGGSGLEKAVKLTVYLTNLKDFEALNGILAEKFKKDPPARAVVEVSALPKGAAVEMDLVALK